MDTTRLTEGPDPVSAAQPATSSRDEARLELMELARNKTGCVPSELLVEHVLVATRDGDWPVARAAMEAVLRRIAAKEQDDLRVGARPKGPLGLYRTRRPRDTERPYRTLVRQLHPLGASCDCPDFLRNGLGLCKHVLTVLEDLAGRSRTWRSAVGAKGAVASGLAWDPVRPLLGRGDWLSQVRWHGADLPPGLLGARWCVGEVGSGRSLEPTVATLDDPARRLALIEAIAWVHGREQARRRDPALAALLVSERDRLGRVVSDRAGSKAQRAALSTLGRTLYAYQRQGVAAFLARGRLLLADDMGLGKTTQAIAACHALWRTGRVQRGLVVVPASLKPQWLREWQAASDAPAVVVEGGPDERRDAFDRARSGFLIVNYEQVVRDLDRMRAWRPDIVVLDEAQRIKNWATKTASSVGALQPAYRLVLTGTPMENRLDELASILEWVDDRALAPRWRLAPLHMATHPDGTRAGGARHLDTLRARLGGVMLRRLRSEVLTQLPGRTDTTIPVELTDAQACEHDELRKPIAQLAQIAQRRPLTRAEFLRLMTLLTTQRIIANGLGQLNFEDVWPALEGRRPTATLLASLFTPKLQELRELLEQVVVEQGRKVVVFSQWRRMLTLAHWATDDLLGRRGLRAVFFTGREGQRRRTQNLVEFHDDPATRVLFATDAGGVGLNLQRAATCCVNLELPWNPAVLEQRIGRIHRLGQEHPIDVYHLVTQGSIEERIAALVGDKRALFTGLFDGTSDEVRFDRATSFFAKLEQLQSAPSTTPPPADVCEDAGESAPAVEALLAQADDAADPAPSVDIASRGSALTLPSAEAVGALLRDVRIGSGDDGRVRLEAPPETAATLAAMFEGLAGLLRASATAR